MNDRRLFRTGVIGGGVALLCCATPLLAGVLGALGLAGWLAYAGYVILPALIVFAAMAAYALARGARRER